MWVLNLILLGSLVDHFDLTFYSTSEVFWQIITKTSSIIYKMRTKIVPF